MHLLLPPSETKRFGGRQPFVPGALSWAESLDSPRQAVREALEAVSRDEDAAVKALKLGVKNRGEREYNLQLETSGAMPVIERYTGVLYDALDVFTVDDEVAGDTGSKARRWIDEHAFVQSALFGLLRADDEIPAYRLSASSRLPALGGSLARVWAPHHDSVLEGSGYVLDLRSKDYAALAPLGTLGASECDFVEVVSRGDNGEVRALTHFNKAAKGDLVRRLARSTANITTRADLIEWARENGLEIGVADKPSTVRLVTKQGSPAASR